MAVTITNNMSSWSTAESTTGWTSDGGGWATYTDFQREGTNCLGDQASSGTLHGYYTGTSTDMSASTIFIWVRTDTMDTQANGGFRLVAGDGTNRAGYYVGGKDNYGLFYNGWSLFKMDGANPLASFATLAGTESSISWSAITQVGAGVNHPAKATGSSDNTFIDYVHYVGNSTAALTIGGGGVGTEGTWADIVTWDESTTNATGILAETVPGSKAYEINYGIEIGDSGTSSSYFVDSDFQIFFTGDGMASGSMDLALLANSTGTNNFVLDNFTAVCIGTVSNWDLSDTNSNTMEITNGQFVDFGTFTFPVTGGTSRKCEDTIFVNCGQVNPSTMTITRLTFVGTTDANGAILANRNMDGHTFTSDGTGHAIYITATGTYTYTSNSFTGYGADATTDAVIYNNSGGAVTINVNSGDTPTYRNGTGASTTIVSGAVTVKVTAVTETGTDIQSAYVHLRASDGTGPFPYQESVTITRSTTTATVAHTGHGMATNDKILLRGITDKTEDNTVHQITVTGVDAYTYTTTDSGSTSYTGTITSTFVALHGLTDVNGEISTSRVYSSDQPVTGWARKSTSSPYYKEGPINDSISSTGGLDYTAVMVSDE